MPTQTLKTFKAVDKFLSEKKPDKTLALVPTMGALHEGHLALVRQAKKENDIVVVSIFVNPSQFGKNEDLAKYPRTFKADKDKLSNEGVDAIFFPTNEIIYPKGYKTHVKVEDLSSVLCGETRPTHFRGVATVVAKLFNIFMPNTAYFGEKDFQQIVIIKRMTEDLNMKVKIKGVPIVREEDGLAMSSRNVYLNQIERKDALLLSKALQKAKSIVKDGELKTSTIIEIAKDILREGQTLSIDYVAVIDSQTLEPLEFVIKNSRMVLAAYAGSTRLIDNMKLM